MHSVLFVCTANQCRSPMAEGLLHLRVGLDNPNGGLRQPAPGLLMDRRRQLMRCWS